MIKTLLVLAIFAVVCCFFSVAALQIAFGIISVLTVILGIIIHYWYITVAVVLVYLILR